MVWVCAGGVGYQFVFGGSWSWVAAGEEVRTGSAYCIFDDLWFEERSVFCPDMKKFKEGRTHISDKQRDQQTNPEAQQRNMSLMMPFLKKHKAPCYKNSKRE